jgi:hypothetical protein
MLMSLSYAAHAQTFRGQLTGTVMDPTGAVIPSVEVGVTNLATGVSQIVTSNERGIYLVSNIEPGPYRVSAALTGFKTFVQEPITVPVSGNITMDITLQVGEMAERVTVIGEAPLLESESASFGQVVSAKTIRDMPLNTRNPMMLVTLTPGVVTSGFLAKTASAPEISSRGGTNTPPTSRLAGAGRCTTRFCWTGPRTPASTAATWPTLRRWIPRRSSRWRQIRFPPNTTALQAAS